MTRTVDTRRFFLYKAVGGNMRMYCLGSVLFLLVSCQAPLPPAPLAPFRANHRLDVVAVLDRESQPDVGEADVRRVCQRIADIMRERFGVDMQLDTVLFVPALGSQDPAVFLLDLLANRPKLPEAAIFFTATPEASRLQGGLNIEVSPGRPFCNRYRSANFGQDRMTVVIADWNHRFGACGYDNGQLVRSTSEHGECHGQAGVPCVWNGRYSICSLDADSHMATPDAFLIDTVVHEFLHSFGTRGSADHWYTEECRARLPRMLASEDGNRYFQMCPDVLETFAQSYVGCPETD